MRDKQIELENLNMKETSMQAFMAKLDGHKSCDVLLNMSSAIVEGIQKHHDATKRKRSPFFKLTQDLDHEQVAFIGLKQTLATMSMSSSMAVTVIGTKIGNDLLIANGREEETFFIDEKSVCDTVAAGLILLRIVIASLPTNYFRVQLERLSKTSTTYTLYAESGLDEVIAENEKLFNIFTRRMIPMVCKPDDWTSVYGGGYLTETAKKLKPLIKRNIKHERPEGDTVFNAINHLQKTPFRVNERVFKVCKLLQGIRPAEMKKLFMKKSKRFSIPCPYDKETDSHIWDKEEGVKTDKKTGKEKKAQVMVYMDEESVNKRKAFFQWSAKKDLHRKKSLARRSLDRSFSTCLELTEELSIFEELYWGQDLDRRSRVYPSAMTGINIQGADYQKAVVEFAEGLPLDFDGDGEGGLFAIIKTLCNHWGGDSGNGVKTDKLTKEASYDWVEGATDWILKCVNDPVNERKWMKADKPFQFLAAMHEWVDWLEYRKTHDDYGFVSHLCDPNDASCSGAQILSAMTRDEIGAMHTNLMDQEVQDLYMAVASKVKENLWSILEKDELAQDWLGRNLAVRSIENVMNGDNDLVLGDESCKMVRELQAKGLNSSEIFLEIFRKISPLEQDRFCLIIRNLVKKPVMVKFYSGTRYGNIEHCNEFIVENEWEDHFRCDGTGKAAAYMGNLIYDSINQVIAGAGRVMEWFVHVADVLGNLQQAVYWTTPVGFKASMKKYATKDVRLRVLFHGESGYNKITLKIPKVEVDLEGKSRYVLDVAKMKSGIAPDIVHSLDAALIMRVAARCAEEGINFLQMVHDSLGSHCCFSSRFNRIIREEFKAMFEVDILKNMYEEFKAQIPEDQQNLLLSPEQFGIVRGNYNLEEVLESYFCFK